MNIITSPLSAKEHLDAIKENMSGHFEFGAERFTGFFLGKWFHVTHHAGHEWNRRYTNEKNAAVGYIKEMEDGCELRFVCFKGLLIPAQFLSLLILLIPLVFVMAMSQGITDSNIIWHIILVEFVAAIPISLIGTLFESFTERSEEGKRILLAMLLDPKDPFSYLNNRNQLP